MTDSQRLTVVGPNLPREARATFHVHAEGCDDLRRGWIRPYAAYAGTGGEGWTAEYDSLLAVEADVYDFAPAENEDYTLGDWQSEFHFAPCVTLPLEASKPESDVAVSVGDYGGRLADSAGWPASRDETSD